MREMELLNNAKPAVQNGQEGMVDDLGDPSDGDTASNSSLQGSSASTPSPPSSTVIAMRGLNNSNNKILNGRRLHLTSSQNQGNTGCPGKFGTKALASNPSTENFGWYLVG